MKRRFSALAHRRFGKHHRGLPPALLRQGAKELVGISNRAGGGRGIRDDDFNVGALVKARRFRKMICTITAPAKRAMEVAFDRMYQAGEIEAELVPQGTLADTQSLLAKIDDVLRKKMQAYERPPA